MALEWELGEPATGRGKNVGHFGTIRDIFKQECNIQYVMRGIGVRLHWRGEVARRS